MKIMKNAIVFKAELPRAELLAKHLEELPFEPVGETLVSSVGFIPNQVTGELVTPIEGGLSITMRYDEKILPKAAVRAALKQHLEDLAEQKGAELTDDERGAAEDRVMSDLISKALVKSTVVNAFYLVEDSLLIVSTTSKDMAQRVIHALIKVCGSVTTQTIHVSNIKGGLTARLSAYLGWPDDDEPGNVEAFDGFQLGDSCLLRHKSNKASFDLDNLDAARHGLRESLDAEMEVERLELVHGTMSFKLTKDFHLRAIDFFGELTEDEAEERAELDGAALWRTEAAVQLLQVSAAIKALCDLLGYKEPAGEEAETVA